MKTKDWLQLISILTSISAIFISNFLGKMESRRKINHQLKVDRYNSFYVPFINFFFSKEPTQLLFFNLIINNEFDSLDNLIKENLKYLGDNSIKKYYLLCNNGLPENKKMWQIFLRELKVIQNEKPKEDKTIKMSDEMWNSNVLFIDFVLEVLTESASLAKELGLSSISQPLIDAYSEIKADPKFHIIEGQLTDR